MIRNIDRILLRAKNIKFLKNKLIFRFCIAYLLFNLVGLLSYYYILSPQRYEILVPPNPNSNIEVEYTLFSLKKENLLVNITCGCEEPFTTFLNISTILSHPNNSDSYSLVQKYVFTNITEKAFLKTLPDGYYVFSYYTNSNNTVKITINGLNIPFRVNVTFGIGLFISVTGLVLYFIANKKIE